MGSWGVAHAPRHLWHPYECEILGAQGVDERGHSESAEVVLVRGTPQIHHAFTRVLLSDGVLEQLLGEFGRLFEQGLQVDHVHLQRGAFRGPVPCPSSGDFWRLPDNQSARQRMAAGRGALGRRMAIALIMIRRRSGVTAIRSTGRMRRRKSGEEEEER